MNAICTFCGHPVDSPAYRRCTFVACNHSAALTSEGAIVSLERRLYRLGQRTGVLHTPALNEPSDQGIHGDWPDVSNIINLKGRN